MTAREVSQSPRGGRVYLTGTSRSLRLVKKSSKALEAGEYIDQERDRGSRYGADGSESPRGGRVYLTRNGSVKKGPSTMSSKALEAGESI